MEEEKELQRNKFQNRVWESTLLRPAQGRLETGQSLWVWRQLGLHGVPGLLRLYCQTCLKTRTTRNCNKYDYCWDYKHEPPPWAWRRCLDDKDTQETWFKERTRPPGLPLGTKGKALFRIGIAGLFPKVGNRALPNAAQKSLLSLGSEQKSVAIPC